MSADTMIIIERIFPQPPDVLFRAWTDPDELSRWRGSPGWHVEDSTGEQKAGGHHHHVKVLDSTGQRVVTDGAYSEFFAPDVFVSRERITGDEFIDPNEILELRVEFVRTGRQGTLARIIQGPYEAAVASEHSTGWERELDRLVAFVEGRDPQEVTAR